MKKLLGIVLSGVLMSIGTLATAEEGERAGKMYLALEYTQPEYVEYGGVGTGNPTRLEYNLKAAKLRIGYQLLENFGVEVSYGQAIEDDTINNRRIDWPRFYGIYGRIVGYPGDNTRLYGIVGKTFGDIEANNNNTTDDDVGLGDGFAFGVGMGYAIGDFFEITLDWMQYADGDGIRNVGSTGGSGGNRISGLSVGFKFAFDSPFGGGDDDEDEDDDF